jgi:Uri superfamily endonuclease
MKGTYLLVMELQKDARIMIGKHGVIDFQNGSYVYVGSALNGLEKRIQRHLRNRKKIHWHIDYLLPYAEVVDVFYKEGTEREECEVAQSFERNVPHIIGFGCSDCECKSHLFHGPSPDIQRVIDSLDMRQYLLHTNP